MPNATAKPALIHRDVNLLVTYYGCRRCVIVSLHEQLVHFIFTHLGNLQAQNANAKPGPNKTRHPTNDASLFFAAYLASRPENRANFVAFTEPVFARLSATSPTSPSFLATEYPVFSSTVASGISKYEIEPTKKGQTKRSEIPPKNDSMAFVWKCQ